MRHLCWVVLLLASVAAGEQAPVLAWARFDDAAQAYEGTRYRFLGDGALSLACAVAPAPGQQVALLWGSKGDQRQATLTVGDQTVRLDHGGWRGFRWVSVPLPLGRGEHVALVLSGPRQGSAFLAEIRLLGPGTGPGTLVPGAGASDKMRVTQSAAPLVAFPEMRAVWEREPQPPLPPPWEEAERGARLAAQAFYRARRHSDGWQPHCDARSGLVPKNLGPHKDQWWPRDSGADNYPFMVLTAAMTDRSLLTGRLLDILRAETKLTSRLGRIPDQWSFTTQDFVHPRADLDRCVFDGAEYVKDGLLYIAEWLGRCPWSERMVGIIDDIWARASLDTPFGKLPTRNFEVNGDLLQACSRLFWFTGERKYLDWAIRLGDYYLLGDQHPTRDLPALSLGDHSCEVINGLSELYVAVAHAASAKREAYRAPLHALYDRILAIGVNPHGLVYSRVDNRTGAHSAGLTDNWGYNYDGLYTCWLLDGTTAYRDAVRKALGNLREHYTGHPWPGGMDGYADSIEGALTLYNREPIASAAAWIDSEIRTMWAKQRPDGVIEGWHGDGNFARTSLMYALWKTQGITIEPWRADVRFGAAREGGNLCISVVADKPWEGRLIFDKQRHKLNMHLPLDYPRINQFPEWFTAVAGARYEVRNAASGEKQVRDGKELIEGIAVSLKAGEETRLIVKTATSNKH